jgi:tight adherence protein C
MIDHATLSWVAFLMGSSLVLLVFMLAGGRRAHLQTRLRDLPGRGQNEPDAVAQLARAALTKMGAALAHSKDEGERTQLQVRLVQAGLYGRQAMVIFLGVKMLLIVAPAVLGLLAGIVGVIPVAHGLIFGALLGVFGMIGPSFWLDKRKAARQIAFRRALPDALDVLVICLEGGLSLTGAIRRVAGELRTAHPLLALELNIAQREMQLGRAPGEALRQFAERSDLEELRSLASVIIQAERYGASLVKALRVHADTLRVKRQQRAEELAQKEAEVERRAATLEVDVELREEKVEERERDVAEREERLARKEAEIAAYIADAQVALRRREAALKNT